MKHYIRKIITFIMAFAMLCISAANAEWTELYNDIFAQHFQLTKLRELIPSSTTKIGDTIYSLMGDGNIYSYEIDTQQYKFVTHVPAFPKVDMEMPYKNQDMKIKDEIQKAVMRLIPSMDDSQNLYGFNMMTGAIGPIDEDGIHFQSVEMDSSVFFYDGSDYPERWFVAPAIKDGVLEGYTVLDPEKTPCITWISFSLLDGSCTQVELPGAFQLCRWKDDKLLAAVLRDGVVKLIVYTKKGEELETLRVTLPTVSVEKGTTLYDLIEKTGPIAYVEKQEKLYYLDNEHLWESSESASFEAVDEFDNDMLIEGLELLASPDGKTLIYGMLIRK